MVNEGLKIAAVYAVGISFALGAWVFKSSMEAKAFNRVTGKNVSTWDAMFIELRVQEQPAPAPPER